MGVADRMRITNVVGCTAICIILAIAMTALPGASEAVHKLAKHEKYMTPQDTELVEMMQLVCPQGQDVPMAYVVGMMYETMLGAAAMHLPVVPDVPYLTEIQLDRSYERKPSISKFRLPAPRPPGSGVVPRVGEHLGAEGTCYRC
jgi:hypothetical protein